VEGTNSRTRCTIDWAYIAVKERAEMREMR
jgi:hypothetical protein